MFNLEKLEVWQRGIEFADLVYFFELSTFNSQP
jgi:hypothetical protein